MGLVEFTEIRPHCTEVTLAVHYEIKNKLFAWLDRRFHFVDAFVTSELRSIRSHFEGIATPYVELGASFSDVRRRLSPKIGLKDEAKPVQFKRAQRLGNGALPLPFFLHAESVARRC